jgi:hypothetical protein
MSCYKPQATLNLQPKPDKININFLVNLRAKSPMLHPANATGRRHKIKSKKSFPLLAMSPNAAYSPSLTAGRSPAIHSTNLNALNANHPSTLNATSSFLYRKRRRSIWVALYFATKQTFAASRRRRCGASGRGNFHK